MIVFLCLNYYIILSISYYIILLILPFMSLKIIVISCFRTILLAKKLLVRSRIISYIALYYSKTLEQYLTLQVIYTIIFSLEDLSSCKGVQPGRGKSTNSTQLHRLYMGRQSLIYNRMLNIHSGKITIPRGSIQKTAVVRSLEELLAYRILYIATTLLCVRHCS